MAAIKEQRLNYKRIEQRYGKVEEHNVQEGRTLKTTMNTEDHANINVIVRCRGRNKQEVHAKSSVIVKIPNTKDNSNSNNNSVSNNGEISINTTNETGIAGDISSRTFTVDKVYGPETDQSQFFQETAEPLFKEFLKGYNCTMFAYGQTGTGKTYTMHGDERIDATTRSFSPNAGIIPRILYTLFDTLNCLQADADFLIKCSFLELYNEELRDLFAVDDSKKLRIFEQNSGNNSSGSNNNNGNNSNSNNSVMNKCTITTQNLEEVVLKDAEHGMRLLQRGINKRQVAATKMNDVSSRSHTIFTINLFKQEVVGPGNQIKQFRISKFNLVDLAGSENIGRSGALNQRAREAGSINQSLLTLGRVINGLVDSEAHIPYRESKLTRLLQDSLGGKTKTVLIANISPAKMNCEETLSTLQYASKAKNIKNKPQIGTLVMKNLLVKELGFELSKLKADLNATRMKNGIYLDESNYNEIQSEIENLKTENNEYKSKTEMMQRKIESLHNQLQESNLSISKKNFEVENLHKIITNLYEKIDRQSANHQNLIENSSRFKTIIDLMNENVFYLLDNEKSMKSQIQQVVNNQMKQENEKLQQSIVKLLNIDETSFVQQLQMVKKKINDEFDEMQSNTEQFSLKIANAFISKLPETCQDVKNELNALKRTVLSFDSDIQENQSIIVQLLKNYDIKSQYFNAEKFAESLQEDYKQRLEKQLVAQESTLIDKMKSLISENMQQQREKIASQFISKNRELLQKDNELVQTEKDKTDLLIKAKFANTEDKLKEKFQITNAKIDNLSTDLEQTIESTSNAQLQVQSELIKFNSKAREQEALQGNIKSYESMLDELRGKVLQDYHLINDESHNISAVKNNMGEYIDSINNNVLLENQENKNRLVVLPNDVNSINKLIEELNQENNKINKNSLPTGKTPMLKNGSSTFSLNNSNNNNNNGNNNNIINMSPENSNGFQIRQFYTPNRSPSKRVIHALKQQSLNFQHLIKIHGDGEEEDEAETAVRSRVNANDLQIRPNFTEGFIPMGKDNLKQVPNISRTLRDITEQVVPKQVDVQMSDANESDNNNDADSQIDDLKNPFKSPSASLKKQLNFTGDGKPRSKSLTNLVHAKQTGQQAQAYQQQQQTQLIRNKRTLLQKKPNGFSSEVIEERLKRSALKRSLTFDSASMSQHSNNSNAANDSSNSISVANKNRNKNASSPSKKAGHNRSLSTGVNGVNGSGKVTKQRKLKSMLPLRKSFR